MSQPWYTVHPEASLDTPALLVYPDRVQHNIDAMLRLAVSPARLMPHVKTYKMAEVVQMQLRAGIAQFKAATVAEAEMTAQAGAAFVLVAHQLVGPKAGRLALLQARYPATQFASLVDCPEMAAHLDATFGAAGLEAHVLVDVNNAMNRSGHPLGPELAPFYHSLFDRAAYPHLRCLGLHVYDGNFRQPDFAERQRAIDAAYAPVAALVRELVAAGRPDPLVVCGGTPAFTTHATRVGVVCSPGTCLLADWGYGEGLPEQPFQWAAVLATRVISKPRPGYLTLDLGHKAVAAENPPDRRVKLLDLAGYRPVAQSEEHLVLEVDLPTWARYPVGHLFYGVPYHICPTVNLYQEVQVVADGRVTGQWAVVARNRRITV
jgi:D-serine deaminase-like pyridoxal phosphate-dependent protein